MYRKYEAAFFRFLIQFKHVVSTLKSMWTNSKRCPLPPPKQRTAYGIYLYFAEPGVIETFMRVYRRILIQIFKRSESKVAGNICPAVKDTIPGIGTGNPGSILSGWVENRTCNKGHPWGAPGKEAGMRVSDSIWWEGIAEGGSQGAIWRWFWERRGRVGGLRPELQNRFRLDIRFGFGMLTADDGMTEISGWKRKMGYGQKGWCLRST